jgi:hypothetical protein
MRKSGNNTISSLDSDGFTVDATGTGGTNESAINYVAWNWKASNATAVSNTEGTITSQVSANTTAGFSIVSYTGTGAAATVGHGLGVAPKDGYSLKVVLALRRLGCLSSIFATIQHNLRLTMN